MKIDSSPSAAQTESPGSSWVRLADSYVHREPLKALASATALGFILPRLPLGAIVGGVVEVSLLVLRPALLVVGLATAIDFLRPKPNRK